jgi:hypothetical protein
MHTDFNRRISKSLSKLHAMHSTSWILDMTSCIQTLYETPELGARANRRMQGRAYYVYTVLRWLYDLGSELERQRLHIRLLFLARRVEAGACMSTVYGRG